MAAMSLHASHKTLTVFLMFIVSETFSLQVINGNFTEYNFKYRADAASCRLDSGLVDEISSYDPMVRKIFNYVVDGPYKNRTYNDLADFVDGFGPRLTGSDVLERSIDFVVNKSINLGLNVHTENVQVPHWTRGDERAAMLKPRYQSLNILGLGYSIATPPEGITAEGIVVNNFQELDELPNEFVLGKIVVYNQVYKSYGSSVQYRSWGATRASAKGAVAALVRSVTPFSIGSPHTGMQKYKNSSKPIPVACITVEDAELLRRIYLRGEIIVIKLEMSPTLNNATSRNILIDINGIALPKQQVIVSGHIDSWDVGQGAMDDGGGAFISWAVPIILNKLNLKPRRTIRTILWTGEELGLIGAASYVTSHKHELNNIHFVLESDEGTFTPTGLEVAGNPEVQCILDQILKLFTFMNASAKAESEGVGSDILLFTSLGIPGGSLLNDNEKYFWFHHSNGDTMSVLDPKSLDLATAFWTAITYVISDISANMPKTINYSN